MKKSRDGKRDVALTTLIDLLVQIVFVFTLLLVASEAIEGAPEERGYVPPEAWKTLISIFDVDPKKTVKEQVAEIESRYQAAKKERDSLARDRDAVARERDLLRKKVDELDARIAELEKKIGVPGFPPCRALDGEELYVLSADIDAAGQITASPMASAKTLEAARLTLTRTGEKMSRQEFRRAFYVWLESGMLRNPQCKYLATVTYDPRAPAGDYQPALSAIWAIFRVQKLSRQASRQ